jgi:hypothetical protein
MTVEAIRVTTVFGTGRAATTDTAGLAGEINTPIDSVFDSSQNYIYLTDQNGGGLIRKLAVTSSTAYSQIYAVKTVFAGKIAATSIVMKSYQHLGVNCNFCTYLALGSSNLFTASAADNVKALLLSGELLTVYRGTVIAGSLGDTTCMWA